MSLILRTHQDDRLIQRKSDKPDSSRSHYRLILRDDPGFNSKTSPRQPTVIGKAGKSVVSMSISV